MLGLVVAVISLLMLCFIVPVYSLKVEEVIYSNIARVIANRIERTHSLPFQSSDGSAYNVYADEARLVPPDPGVRGCSSVELIGPAWMKYEQSPASAAMAIPKEFWMARTRWSRSTARHPPIDGDGLADGGIKFPRIFFGNVQVGVGSSEFGPFEIPSLISENVKFINISRLAQLPRIPARAWTCRSSSANFGACSSSRSIWP